MIRTGRGPFLPSIGAGVLLGLGCVFAAVVLFLLAGVLAAVLNVAVLALLIAAPAAVLLGSFGFLHVEEDGSGFTDAGD